MFAYHISLREVRLATDGTDDVALFDVTREGKDGTWTVPTLTSPLFRLINMRATVAADERREMVAGLGARAIAEHLHRAGKPPTEPLLFSLDYPGAPGEPRPLPSFDHMVVEVEDHSTP